MVVVADGQKIEFLHINQRFQAVIDVLPDLVVGHLLDDALLLIRQKHHQIEVAHRILAERRVASDHRLWEVVDRVVLIVGEEVVIGPVLVKHVLVVLIEGSLLIVGGEQSSLVGLRGVVILVILVEERGWVVVLAEGSVVVIVVLIVAEDVIAGVGVIEHASALLPHSVIVIVVGLSEDASVGVVVVILAEDVIGAIIWSGVICMSRWLLLLAPNRLVLLFVLVLLLVPKMLPVGCAPKVLPRLLLNI